MINLHADKKNKDQAKSSWAHQEAYKKLFLILFPALLLLHQSILFTQDFSLQNNNMFPHSNQGKAVVSANNGNLEPIPGGDNSSATPLVTAKNVTEEPRVQLTPTDNSTIVNTIVNTTIPNMVPDIDYNYMFLRYKVDYKTKYPLPDWMEAFLSKQPTGDPQQHHEMLTDPSNKFLVMVCYRYKGALDACGGLTDRLMNLPWNMWVAHQTNRKLLIKYYKPRPLEEFLVPPPPSDNGFNWMVPDGYFQEEWDAWGSRSHNTMKWNRRWMPTVKDLNKSGMLEQRAIFINNNLIGGRGTGTLKQMGNWTDDLWQGVFFRFFQPSREVARQLDLITKPLQLEAGTYSAMHVRAKFPLNGKLQKRGSLKYVDIKSQWADKAEAARLDMTDNTTRYIVSEVGNHAMACAIRVKPDTKYVYAASDVSELIEYLKTDSPYWADNKTKNVVPPVSWEAFDYNPAMSKRTNKTEVIGQDIHGWGVSSWEIPTNAKVIMRHDYKDPPAHFDSKRYEYSHPGLFGTIVDYWMMGHARGHSIGVGGFGRFGSVLAGNDLTTRARHRDYAEQSPSCATSAERKAWKKLHPELYPEKKKRRRGRRRRLEHNTTR